MMLNEKRVLVTGGAGFIGSHVVEWLVNANNKVAVLDNLASGSKSNLAKVHDKIKFIQGDVRDKNDVKNSLKNVEVVFHLAANASVPHSIDDPRYDFETNSVGTFNLLEECLQNNVRKVFFASSAAVYGDPIYLPFDESHPTNPISPYGASKLSAEKIGFAFKRVFGLDFVALRIFNVYGPRQRKYVMFDFIKKLKQNSKRLEILGSGSQVRQFIYIDDLIDAFQMVCEKRKEEIYNIAGDQIISIHKLAEMIVSLISPDAEIVAGGENWKGDVEQYTGDTLRLRELGFKPRVNIADGLTRMIRWYDETHSK